ncbi:MAG: hypothetical protein AAB360_03100, partial [Patescibacteria group bacterium]
MPRINIEQRPKTENARAATEWYVSPEGVQTNTGSINSPWNLTYALAGAGGSIQPGDTVWLRGGTYGDGTTRFTSNIDGTDGNRITVRQYPNERATIDGQLWIEGSNWTDYWGFDIMHPTWGGEGNVSASRDSCVWAISSAHVRFINMAVHDCPGGNGIGFWSTATDSDIYGSLVYSVGDHGHGIYTQNADGSRKTIKDSVVFNNTKFGVHAYTENGYVRHYDYEGNTFFLNDYGEALLAGRTSGADINFIGNYLYNPLTGVDHNGVQFGYSNDHENMVFRDNYLAMLAGWQLISNKFAQVDVQYNTIIGRRMARRHPPDTGMISEVWDNNDYWQVWEDYGFNNGSAYVEWPDWRTTTNYDPNSTWINHTRPAYTEPTLPTENKIFVRPNQFESGRANIIVYNWNHSSSVAVDVSGVLSNNDQYEVRNVLDYFGTPTTSGRYTESTINIPMTTTATGPEFGTFVLTSTPAAYHTIIPSVSGQGSLSISSPTQVL